MHGASRTHIGSLVHHAFALSPAARVAWALSSASRAFGATRRFGSGGLRRKGLGRLIGQRCSILADARRGWVCWKGRRWLRHGWRSGPRTLASLAQSGRVWGLQVAQGHKSVSFWQSGSRGCFYRAWQLIRTPSMQCIVHGMYGRSRFVVSSSRRQGLSRRELKAA